MARHRSKRVPETTRHNLLHEDEFRQTVHGHNSCSERLHTLFVESQAHFQPVLWPRVSDARNRPLGGIKGLDVTRVIAGPSISKILALLGADVLRISSRKIPEATILMLDTQVGKRNVVIGLKSVEGKLEFRALLEEADVLLDGYRSGGWVGWVWEGIANEIVRRRQRRLCGGGRGGLRVRGRKRMGGMGSGRIAVGISRFVAMYPTFLMLV